MDLDLQDRAELFSASVKLQDVATGLKQLIEGQPTKKTENVDWVRKLIGRIYRGSEQYQRGEHPEMENIAANLRPLFYRTLLQLEITFDPVLFERVYEQFDSPGTAAHLPKEALEQAYRLYQRMATGLLTELNRGRGQI